MEKQNFPGNSSSMASLRHLAIRCRNMERLCEFDPVGSQPGCYKVVVCVCVLVPRRSLGHIEIGMNFDEAAEHFLAKGGRREHLPDPV